MPLNHSKSKSAFNKNVDTLMHEVGKSPYVQSRKQALAIAYSIKRGRADGGKIPTEENFPGGLLDEMRRRSTWTIQKPKEEGRAFGGVAPMLSQAMNPMMTGGMGVAPQMAANGVAAGMPQTPIVPPGSMMNQSPTVSRPLKRGGIASSLPKPVKMTTGPLVSTVPGRTDKHTTHVPSGSYVIPADIVSGRGQGNTLAGMTNLHKFFGMGEGIHTPSAPTLSAQRHFAKGGTADKHVGKPVQVVLAGGEIVVPPENVHKTMERVHRKKLTLEDAHKKMDAWVLFERKKLRKTLAKLPGPVRD